MENLNGTTIVVPFLILWGGKESNLQLAPYKDVALTIELPPHV